MEDNIKRNFELHSASPLKSDIVKVSLDNFKKKHNTDNTDNTKNDKVRFLTKEYMERLAKKLVEQHPSSYKMNRAEKRQAIRKIVKDIKIGKIKVDDN